MDAGQRIRQQDFIDRFQQPRPPVPYPRQTHPPHDPRNLIILLAFNLGVLCVLGAILLPAPNWVRAKNAKLAKG